MSGVGSAENPVPVSVVVPAYNAGRTLDETLRSVRGQSHTALDIVVVDDGSTDATAAIAAAHAKADPRLRLIRRENGGVAAARNTGWRAARADFIALIDSDDLWAPRTIEKLLAAMLAGGPATGVSYCFFTSIDLQSMAPPPHYPQACTGDVLDRILLHNFVGCGSTMLVRRETLLATGGFDESLRAAGAQGCDDYLFCCRAAERFHYACVPEVLVGYRDTPGGISSSQGRMLRSWMLAAEQMIGRQPGRRELILLGLRNYAQWMLGLAASHRQLRVVARILALMLRHHPRLARQIATGYLPHLAIYLARRLKHRLAVRLRRRPADPPVPRTRFAVGAPPAIPPPAIPQTAIPQTILPERR